MKKIIFLITSILTAAMILSACSNLEVKNSDEKGETPEEKDVFNVETEKEDKEVPEETPSTAGLPHKYTIETLNEEITASDGTLLATYDYSYPVFECNDGDDAEYIGTINEMFKNNALEHISYPELDLEYLEEAYNDAQNDGYWFNPYGYSYSFDIHTDAKGILSVTENLYFYTGGAHGGMLRDSHTFDVVNGKELSLSDLLYGSNEEITNAFTEKFLEVEDMFFDDPSVVVPEELPNAQYFVDAEGVTAYFQQYQVGPYAVGFVSATISDKEMLKYDFSDTAN